jgi:fused signal recognition particle receptor
MVLLYYNTFPQKTGGKMGVLERLKEGLARSRRGLNERVEAIFTSGTIDEETLEELEETLIASDFGVNASMEA